MVTKINKQHTLGIILLSATAILWGAGFVLNSQLSSTSFVNAPAMLNAVRFVGAALILLIIFARKLKFNKKTLLYGSIGGIMLFAGFQLQLVGLGYTTPAHCGFFTASYIVFVPFMSWIAYKKRPKWIVFVGIALAITGLVILNINKETDSSKSTWIGDLLTLGGATMFALQIVWGDYALKKGMDYNNLTFWQVAFAGVLFILYSLIFESKNYDIANFDVNYSWWRLLIVVFGGTAFAYYAQTYAQMHLTPSETSLLLACESPIGMVISVIVGLDNVTWTIFVGGALVVIAVVLVEVVPALTDKKRKIQEQVNVTETTENTTDDTQ